MYFKNNKLSRNRSPDSITFHPGYIIFNRVGMNDMPTLRPLSRNRSPDSITFHPGYIIFNCVGTNPVPPCDIN